MVDTPFASERFARERTLGLSARRIDPLQSLVGGTEAQASSGILQSDFGRVRSIRRAISIQIGDIPLLPAAEEHSVALKLVAKMRGCLSARHAPNDALEDRPAASEI